MPAAKQNSLFGCLSTYMNNWMEKRKGAAREDTTGVVDAGVGDKGGDDKGDVTGGHDKSDVLSVKEYSASTSVHGLKYVWASNRSKRSRIVWALFFAFMLGTLSLTLFTQLGAMANFPTLTKQTVAMETEVLFPAVTICNLNQFRKSYVQDKPWLQQALLQMSEFSEIFEPINFTDPIWLGHNEEASPEAVARVVDQASHPLNETIFGCQWRNKAYNCSELFKTVVTDFGVCYSFNTYETEKKQRTSDLFGNMYGLSIILNTQQDEYVLSQYNMATGFRALLHGFWETPQMIEKGFTLGPGLSYFGKISGHKMSLLPAPFKAFGDKECLEVEKGLMHGYLRYFPVYTTGACSRECQMNYSSNACGCRGMYDPMDHVNMCSLQAYLECYLPSFWKFRRSTSLRNSCICPVPCTYQAYDVTLSMASYPSAIFMENLNRTQSNTGSVDPKVYRDNFLELHLYYDNAQTINIEQFPQYTFGSIMSSVGGQMGVFLGASLISLVEFFDFLIGTIMSRIRKAKKCRVDKLTTVPEKN